MYPEVEEGLVEHDSLDPLVGRELEWVSETFFYQGSVNDSLQR